jgi:hypothetical protein
LNCIIHISFSSHGLAIIERESVSLDSSTQSLQKYVRIEFSHLVQTIAFESNFISFKLFQEEIFSIGSKLYCHIEMLDL